MEWFYSPTTNDEEGEGEVEDSGVQFEKEDYGMDVDGLEDLSLKREVGEEMYRELVMEHLRAEEQLERQRAAQRAEFEALAILALETQTAEEEGICLSVLVQDKEETSESDGDWDLLSITSSDESAAAYIFEDWEEVTVQV